MLEFENVPASARRAPQPDERTRRTACHGETLRGVKEQTAEHRLADVIGNGRDLPRLTARQGRLAGLVGNTVDFLEGKDRVH